MTSHCPGAEDTGINKIKICVTWRTGEGLGVAPGRGRRAFISKVNAFNGFCLFQVYILLLLASPLFLPESRVSHSEYFFHRNFKYKGILTSSISCTINLAAITRTSAYSFDHFHSLIAMIKHKALNQSKCFENVLSYLHPRNPRIPYNK